MVSIRKTKGNNGGEDEDTRFMTNLNTYDLPREANDIKASPTNVNQLTSDRFTEKDKKVIGNFEFSTRSNNDGPN